MKKNLFKKIYNYFPNADINTQNWQKVLKLSKNEISNFYLLGTVNYYAAYFLKNKSINLSFVLYHEKQPVGIMPLIAHKGIDGCWLLSSQGEAIIEPIFIKSLNKKIKKIFEIKILNLIFDLSKELKILICHFTNINHLNLSNWYSNLLECASSVYTTHHYFVNLSLDIGEIKSRIRKRYRTYINKGNQEWQIKVHENISNNLFKDLILLHKQVAGRTTRPIESWELQKQSINEKEAFLITISDKHNKLIGFGLFNNSQYSGKYSVGVYKRELFDKPLGHVVQMKAIEFLKNKGLKWYEIGQKHIRCDKKKPSKKEIDISFFKKGFATDLFARQHLVIRTKTIHDNFNLNLRLRK
jgi:FemAB family protein